MEKVSPHSLNSKSRHCCIISHIKILQMIVLHILVHCTFIFLKELIIQAVLFCLYFSKFVSFWLPYCPHGLAYSIESIIAMPLQSSKTLFLSYVSTSLNSKISVNRQTKYCTLCPCRQR